MLDVDTIEINDEQTYDARFLASRFSESQIRKRGMIDMLGVSCAVNYLRAKRLRIDTKKSIHKIPFLFEQFKIADIYYGNYRIDVITLYKEKTIKIPKIHVDMDIVPHFYFIVQIGAKIKEAKMIGFVDGKRIVKCSHDSKYYYPTLDMIYDFQRFCNLTKRSIPSKTIIGKHIDCIGLFLKLIDDDLSGVYKRQLIQHLMNCDACRSRFIDVMEFEKLANNICFYPDILKRYQPKTRVKYISENLKNEENVSTFVNDVEKFDSEVKKQEYNETQNDEDIKIIHADTKGEQKKAQMFDIIDGGSNLASRKVIDTIFGDIKKIDMGTLPSVIKPKYKRILLISIIMFVILSSFVLICANNTSDLSSEDQENLPNLEELGDNYQDDNNEYNSSEQIPYEGKQLVQRRQDTDEFNISQPKIDKPNYSPTITKVSWEAPQSLVKKGTYTRFLQLTGKNIKLNLQNDLLLVNDVPTNKGVKVDIKISPSGDVEKIELAQTSGSNPIDASVEKVVEDTLKYMKPPNLGFGSKAVKLTLTIDML